MSSNNYKNSSSLDRLVIDQVHTCSDEEFDDLLSAFGTDSIQYISLIGWRESKLTTKSMRRIDKKFKSYGLGYSYLYMLLCSLVILIGLQVLHTTPNKKRFVQQRILEPISVHEKQQHITLIGKFHASVKTAQQMKEPNIFSTPISTNGERNSNTNLSSTTEFIEPRALPFSLRAFGNSTLKKDPVHLGSEYYLYNLKLVDYRKIRKDSYLEDKILLSGTNADGEERTNTQYPSKTEFLLYTELLGEAMLNFSEQKYSTAIYSFDLILKTYPNDVNALFYTGMAYYYLANFSVAADYLKKSSKSEFANFQEESNFYLASVWIKSPETLNSGATLLESIAKGQGYYTIQANLILQALKK